MIHSIATRNRRRKMTTANALTKEARSLRAAIGRSSKTFVAAHRQIALRRISTVLLLAEKNLAVAQTAMADARFHAQFILQA
jgi:hypothetical protein